MTKKVTVQVFKKDDPEAFATALANFNRRQDEAEQSGEPDKFRILCVSDQVDSCYVNAPAHDVFKHLNDAHIVVTQEIE